ncbi:hypothetical protein TWF481_010754 [Arthrobotrys musiformis]|uniref:Uncharacterized protein n=1 Tax=Arthrobotrys musiformis TaxID=47236 RepID=A0AAV9W1U0_9PEZI
MNCPAKNDDDDLKHPDWNQSPSYLAAELTTRQDLNGIANSRERKNNRCDNLWFGDGTAINDIVDAGLPPGTAPAEGGVEEVPWPSSKTAVLVGNYRRLVAGHSESPSLARRAWDWFVWLASVLLCSSLLSAFQNSRSVTPNINTKPLVHYVADTVHKRSTCPTGGISSADYNTPLHVGALFIILAVSTAACSFPLLASKFPLLRIPPLFFFIVRHFGTGVLIATAFVHLLPTAFILLGNKCLGAFWVEDYPAIPGAIALAGVFFVIVIEMVFHPSRHMDLTPVPAITPTENRQDGDIDAIQPVPQIMDPEKNTSDTSFLPLTSEQKVQKDVLQCILLEVGILFHSVFIGMALSVSIGSEFIVLLIAIAFHQTFEGLALGSRIANIPWPEGSLKPWFMALAYGCTTPIGQALGIALSSLYSPDSEVGLILVGTMNAISAGLLVFASLVELLSEDFLSYESWRMLRGRKRVGGCLLVFGGAFCMSLVGAWA